METWQLFQKSSKMEPSFKAKKDTSIEVQQNLKRFIIGRVKKVFLKIVKRLSYTTKVFKRYYRYIKHKTELLRIKHNTVNDADINLRVVEDL